MSLAIELFANSVLSTWILVRLGDEACLKAWKRICDASRKEFQALYDRLGVTIQERGESFYNPRLKSLVQGLREQVRIV